MSITEYICNMMMESGCEPPRWEPYGPSLTPGQRSSIENIVRKHEKCSRIKYDRETGNLHAYYHFKIDLEGKVTLESEVI